MMAREDYMRIASRYDTALSHAVLRAIGAEPSRMRNGALHGRTSPHSAQNGGARAPSAAGCR